GNMSSDERNRTLLQFRTGNVNILLITLMAGGVGLNLNCANHVVLLDSWWNKSVENQAIDRVHRIGQTKQVYVYKLLVKNTIEEWISDMKDEKALIEPSFRENKVYHIDKGKLKEILKKYVGQFKGR